MGSWGPDVFENDDAADFQRDLKMSPPDQRGAIIREALQLVPDSDEYIEDESANWAIAAAAAVAAARGGHDLDAGEFGIALPATDLPTPDEDMVARARQVLDRIVGENSGWRDNWAYATDPGDLDKVLTVVATLRAALN